MCLFPPKTQGRRRPHPPLQSQAWQAVNRPGWKPPGLLLWGPQGGKPHPSICPPCGAAGRLSRSCHSSRTRKAAYTRPFLPSRRVTDRRDSRPHIGSFFARGTEAGEGGRTPAFPGESHRREGTVCVFLCVLARSCFCHF